MQCDYCDYWKEYYRDKSQLLDWQNLDKIYSFIENQPYNCEILHLFTEPLLNFDNIQKAGDLHHLKNINHNIFTNGLLLTTDKLNWCLSHDMHITLSYDSLNQNLRSPNTFDLITDLIYQHPYCLGISATLHKTGLEDALLNAKWLSHLPIQGACLKPNTIYNWTKEELVLYYSYIKEHCSQEELIKIGLDSWSILETNGLRPGAHKTNSLFIQSDGKVFQFYELWMDKDYIGDCSNFQYNIKDLSKTNYYSNDYNCKECELLKYCQPYNNPDRITLVGSENCDYRKTLNLFVGE